MDFEIVNHIGTLYIYIYTYTLISLRVVIAINKYCFQLNIKIISSLKRNAIMVHKQRHYGLKNENVYAFGNYDFVTKLQS